jgi:Ulp1 protease family, C-terminal catalytic domain
MRSLSRAEERYPSIQRWTANVDIFSKQYIIIPINERWVLIWWMIVCVISTSSRNHWYLAIIYQPEHILRRSISTNKGENESDASKEASCVLYLLNKHRSSWLIRFTPVARTYSRLTPWD